MPAPDLSLLRLKPEVIETRAIDGKVEEKMPGTCLPPPWGWACGEHPHKDERHYYPTWDIGEHYFDDKCECGPELDEHGFFVHNAFDGRERYERGLALLN